VALAPSGWRPSVVKRLLVALRTATTSPFVPPRGVVREYSPRLPAGRAVVFLAASAAKCAKFPVLPRKFERVNVRCSGEQDSYCRGRLPQRNPEPSEPHCPSWRPQRELHLLAIRPRPHSYRIIAVDKLDSCGRVPALRAYEVVDLPCPTPHARPVRHFTPLASDSGPLPVHDASDPDVGVNNTQQLQQEEDRHLRSRHCSTCTCESQIRSGSSTTLT
jgi:hypothetical protein